jgi:dienelactone hydrolase
MKLAEIQRALDRPILQYMEEMRPSGFRRHEYAFQLVCFVHEPVITKDMARAICRSLTDRGYAFYMRGLFTEDGEVAGSGYGITEKGAAYLETLFEPATETKK